MADASLFAILAAPVSGFLGVIVGAAVTTSREEKKRKLEWHEKQLREFYSPLWSMRLEIKSLSLHRLRVEQSSSGLAQEMIEQTKGMHPSERGKFVREISEQYTADIPYNNKQLVEIILPAYREMQDVFRQRLHLADPDTVEHFYKLVGFNETWKRSQETEMPFDVALATRVQERELYPLYDHLEQRTNELKEAIRRGRLPKRHMPTKSLVPPDDPTEA